jgi:pyrroloquinoline quinone biosynthesis protein B
VFGRVLGSAAGGGFPQWNCACPGCSHARAGRLPARSETCVAVRAENGDWVVLGAPAAVSEMIARHEPLAPRGIRGTSVECILLANGDLDQTLGLLSLREGSPLTILATSVVIRGFREENALARTLERVEGQTTWRALTPGERVALASGLGVTAIAIPGKSPLHLEGRAARDSEENVAFVLDDARRRTLVFAPSVGAPTVELERAAERADAILFDGTFWSEDELQPFGATRGARAMGHWPLGGVEGSLRWLATLRARRILIHVNNTNPILLPGSSEHRAVLEAGVEIGFDGLEFAA